MQGDKQITRRGALAALATTGVAALGAGGGTYVYLSDEKQTESPFNDGEIDIEVTLQAFEFADMDDNERRQVSIGICNAGSLPVKNVILKNITLSGSNDVASALEIVVLTYNGVDMANILPGDSNGNGIVDLQDVESSMDSTSLTDSDSSLDGIQQQDTCKELTLAVQMDHSRLVESAQGKSVTATVEIKAEQEPP